MVWVGVIVLLAAAVAWRWLPARGQDDFDLDTASTDRAEAEARAKFDDFDVAVASAPVTNKAGDVAILSVIPKSAPDSPQTKDLVNRIRVGAKQVLLAGNALQGAGFVAYLFSDSFVAVTAWTVVVAVGRTAFWGSYGNIVAAISVPGEREKWFGFLGALRNVGFALGGLVSGLAITIGTQTAYAAVVVANAVS